MANSFVSEVRAFTYDVLPEGDDRPVARLIVTETKQTGHRGTLHEINPEYGFRLIDQDGSEVAYVSPGYWPFMKAAMLAGVPMHSEHCAEDSATAIGKLVVTPIGDA